MSEPLRLRDESASALERALLDVGRSYRSSGTARAKTMAALGVAGSATLLAGTAQAVPFGTLAKMTWGKLLAAISIVGAAAAVPVGYFAWQRHHPARHAGSAPAVMAAKASDPAPTQVPPAEIVGTLAGGLGTQATESGSAGAAHPARPAVTLAHELSSLDAARGLLARGDATGALARLDAYGRAYPHGRLGLEAEVLRIDALDESGRSDAARVRAEAFLQHHPHSVLAARVRTRLGD
ncbi:MAG TPA: hypothetical protein VLA79_09420 [Polyangia bacterium]|nr:hypothetical protein [Polyangia bacterium]